MVELNPVRRGAMGVVLVTVLLDSVSFSMVMPVMPSLISELTGGTLSESAQTGGLLLFVFAVVQFLSAPLLGNLGDKYGRRPVLLLSLVMFGFDYLIMGLAPTLGLLFLGRILSGIPGASWTPAYAYTADVSTHETRSHNFALVGAAFSAGFIVGPAFGGLMGTLGTRAPFLAAAAVAFANFTIGFFVLKESLAPENRRPFEWKRANPVGALLQLRKHPQVLGLAVALTLWFLAIQAYPATWAFYTMEKFGWTVGLIGLSLAAYGATIAFAQAKLAKPVIKRLGEERTAIWGILLAAIAFTGQAFAAEGWQVFVWVPLWLIAALSMPTINAMMSKRTPPNAQGELQGANASLMSIAAIIGPVLVTQIFGAFTGPTAYVYFPGAPFLAGAVITLSAGVLLAWVLKRHPTPVEEQAPEGLTASPSAGH